MRRVPNRLTYRNLRAMLWARGVCDFDRLEQVWEEVKDRPVSQREMAVLMRHFTSPGARGDGGRLRVAALTQFLAKSPRPDIVSHVRGLELADEVVQRNEGAFKRLAKT